MRIVDIVTVTNETVAECMVVWRSCRVHIGWGVTRGSAIVV